MKTLLIMGGAGYIGSVIAAHAIENGYAVVVIDQQPLPDVLTAMGVIAFQGSIADKQLLNAVCSSFDPQVVIHCAGLTEVTESCTKPARYYQNNVAYTLTALELFVERGINYHIFSSSATVYGVPYQVPIAESHQLLPINPYGRGKLFVEQILADFEQAYGIHTGILRYFNAAGTNSNWRLGERHEPETHLIPRAMKAILNNEVVTVYGDDYPTHDGTCVRDYVHVDDIASAHIRAAEYLWTNKKTFICNLGTARGSSVLDVIRAIEQVTQHKAVISFEQRRQGDSPILIADNKQAKELLGWQPLKSDLLSIVDSVYQCNGVQYKKVHTSKTDNLSL